MMRAVDYARRRAEMWDEPHASNPRVAVHGYERLRTYLDVLVDVALSLQADGLRLEASVECAAEILRIRRADELN